MNRKQETELAALLEAQRINPKATVFRRIPIGGQFRFIIADPNKPGQYRFTLPRTKMSAGWYYHCGKNYRAGVLSAVLPID